MPTARGALGAAEIDGRIYAVGGVARDGRPNSSANEVYDPASDRWTKRAPLPTPRDHLAVMAWQKRLYAIGGRIGGNYARNLADSEVYDPATDRWERRRPMPTARSGIAGVALGGRLFVFGGEEPAGTFNQTEAYEPAADRWSTLRPMPTARHGLGTAAVGDVIYVIGGGPRPGGSVSAANEAFIP